MSKEHYVISAIAKQLRAIDFKLVDEVLISQLVIDSRSIIDPGHSLFFALPAAQDGHQFIDSAYQQGIRNFVISDSHFAVQYSDANILLVADVKIALQELALHNREIHHLPVIAISGSNGKTIVKEWLFQLLASDYNIIRSPKSFNSQIGVPLSVWQIRDEHNLAIFEAGISKPNEMQRLAEIIQPTIGILTNIGEAHAEGFESPKQKLIEKLRLFHNTDLFIYAPEYLQGITEQEIPGKHRFSWSMDRQADLRILFVEPIKGQSYIKAIYKDAEIECLIPFTDKASIENAIICWATLLAMGYNPEEADWRLEKLTLVQMRLELKNGINQSSVIDDSYSADISSLAIALDFLNQQNQHEKKTLILSDLLETGKPKPELYAEIAALVKQKDVQRLIGIGSDMLKYERLFELEKQFFATTDEFLQAFPTLLFNSESILVKGARKFGFERISKLLTQKIHDTVLEVNLNALTSNLKFYKSQLKPGVKMMAMVKAFSYGSGSFEIANVLQFNKVDYLAVAYTDEGVALRKSGITLPIMVMSPEPAAFEAIVKYKLEPELYNLEILNGFIAYQQGGQSPYPVHLKIDTGMHRLGFDETYIDEMLCIVRQTDLIKVESIFSHLAASDDEKHDDFTRHQISLFKSIAARITDGLGYQPLRHLSNTSGITRHPEAQLDMVRLGIGLYGFDAAQEHARTLQTVAVLKTTVTQVKQIKPHESVGYSRRGVMPAGGTIATVKIGYADGYSRMFGNGVGKMLINGTRVATIGSICMDMCMLDITGMDVKNGDEVVVFNGELTISELAGQIQTIPYEILTNISQRVKRVYFYE